MAGYYPNTSSICLWVIPSPLLAEVADDDDEDAGGHS
ncbi:hypothetical protein NC651_015574 [Populus alba x Populus x berolinensis]|nr:hypothetical protein NC651_015574 [Populus alba x Populus x berolinensis]